MSDSKNHPGPNAQIIPKTLNLSQDKPAAIPALTRRVESIATNAQEFSENMMANIVIDTSTPGAFLDPTQSLINFNLTIKNTNPYVDYINLSSCGLGSLIQEMRIICQGTPIEEILSYNTMFEMWMDIGGHAQEEFKMYVENSWRAPVLPGESDFNFVKPPMVDREGVIMCPNAVNTHGTASRMPWTDGTYKSATATAAAVDNIGAAAVASTGVNNGRVYGNNFLHSWKPSDAYWTGTNAPGTIRSSAWTNRIDNTYVTWPSTIRPTKKTETEKIQNNDRGAKRYRLQDYLTYLANVKNIPVGVKPSKSFIRTTNAVSTGEVTPANWNFAPGTVVTSHSQEVKFNVSLPIFSGLLGVWAEKAFPTMLISPGSFYIQLKFAKATQAFQTAMDPCRRIFGTYRDYVPNPGLDTYYATERNGIYIDDTRKALTAANVWAHTDGVATTGSTWLAYSNAATKGYDFAWQGDKADPRVTGTAAAKDNLFVTQTNGGGLGGGLSTGNPKPQYVPRDTPWLAGGAFIAAMPACVEEQYIPYGTYLPASTAQVRRCFTDAHNSVSTAGGIYNASTSTPTYTISNLRFVGQQLTLPDSVTAGIVKSAASSDVSLHAHSCKTYQSIANTGSDTQSIIIPAKIASANALFCLFQNTNMLENPYYLSCTRVCPFTSLQWTPVTTVGVVTTQFFVGSTTPPAVSGLSTTDAFSIQLRLGNELLPQQPITNLNGLVHELQRAIHAVPDMATSVPVLGSFRQQRFSDVLSATSVTNEYCSLKSGDFTVPYVPVEALDDQTITLNPVFLDYGLANSGRGPYVVNEFLPPVSKFMIGFDLDTFPGQNDISRGGKYLGNGPLNLQLSGCKAFANSPISGSTEQKSYQMTTVILHDIRFSIMAGGQVLAYY